jgi:hypothetical protein
VFSLKPFQGSLQKIPPSRNKLIASKESPGVLVKMQSLGPHPCYTESESMVDGRGIWESVLLLLFFFFNKLLKGFFNTERFEYVWYCTVLSPEIYQLCGRFSFLRCEIIHRLKQGVLLTGIAKAAPRRQANKIQVPISGWFWNVSQHPLFLSPLIHGHN